jgi:hypothetical protein
MWYVEWVGTVDCLRFRFPTSGKLQNWQLSLGRTLDGPITQYGRPVHCSGLAAEIPNHIVLRASIVPYQQIADSPSVAEREIVMGCMRVQVLEQRPALLYRHPLEVPGRNAVDVQRALAGLRMGTHNWM